MIGALWFSSINCRGSGLETQACDIWMTADRALTFPPGANFAYSSRFRQSEIRLPDGKLDSAADAISPPASLGRGLSMPSAQAYRISDPDGPREANLRPSYSPSSSHCAAAALHAALATHLRLGEFGEHRPPAFQRARRDLRDERWILCRRPAKIRRRRLGACGT